MPGPNFQDRVCWREVRAKDEELAWIQVFMLDPAGPLIRVLKAMKDHPDKLGITIDETKTTKADAVRLQGNASEWISRVRRRKLLKVVYPEIQDLTNEDIYCEAAPSLFGIGFESKIKERADCMKLLQGSRPPPSTSKKSFKEAVPLAPEVEAGRIFGGGNPGWKAAIKIRPGTSLLFAGPRDSDSCRQRPIPVIIVLNCQSTCTMKNILVQIGVSPLKDCYK